MANDLDALFELFEGDDEAAEDKVAEDCTAPAGQADAQAVPVLLEDADDMDMLLSLADEAVTEPRKAATNSTTAEKVAIPLAGSVIAARSRSPLASSVGTNQTNSNSLSKSTTVRMSQSKAFQTLQGSTSERNNHKSSSRSGQPDGATPAGTKSSSIHSSSSTGARVAKQQGVSQCQHFVEKLTGLKIKNPRVSGIVMRERYKQFTYITINKARDHVAAAGSHWVVIGVLVSKVISSTSQGAPYSRWRISDLAGSDTWISLFGDAHKDNYAEAEGSILAFYNPRFASKGPAGSSSSSSSGLAVSQPHQIELLATSLGWGICKGRTKTGSRCNNAVDTTVSGYCQYHALQQAKSLKKPPPAAAAAAGGKRGLSGLRGIRAGLGLAGPAADDGAAGDSVPVVAAVSNGKVFDARSNSWSTTTAAPQHISSSSSGGGRLPSAAGSGAGTRGATERHAQCGKGASSSSRNNNGSSTGGMQRNGVQAAAAAAVQEAAQRQDQESLQQQRQQQRQQQQQQAELRERLRLGLQQQKQQKPHGSVSPALSSSISISQQSAAGTAAAAGRGDLRPSGAAGFSLSSMLASVACDGQQQQQQKQSEEDWMGQRQQEMRSASATVVVDRLHSSSADEDVDAEMEDEPVIRSSSNGQLAVQQTAREADRSRAAAVTAAATGGPVGPIDRLLGLSSTSTHSIKPAAAAAAAQKRMRADLGLGPKPGSSSNSARAGSNNSGSKLPHVSRIGAISGKPAAAVAAAGAGCGNSGFKAAFGRVLQRADINKPNAKLLDAAADQKHAAMMSKLLDQYEQKDQLAQQLEGITKLQVTAFECRTCKVLTEKRRSTCSGHDIVAVRVMKRWWTCDACGWKIHTLRELMPTKRCPKCRDPGVMFSVASAYNAPKPQLTSAGAINNTVASRDAMLPRGVEHAFCLQNSL